jgi:hypothetical protein
MDNRSFFQKPVSELKYEDIEWLVKEKMPESYNLDYKRDNYENSFELAKDISAFANTSGGRLVLGVDEKKNKETLPGEITGIVNEEDLIKRLKDRIINSIMPHPQIQFSELIPHPHKPDRLVLVIDVPKSPNSLHMVVAKKKNCYYKRYHDQNIPMDEYEVRTRYTLLSKSEEDIDRNLKKVMDRTRQRLAASEVEKGVLFVAISPVFQEQKFTDHNIAKTFDDPKKYKKPNILFGGGISTKPRLGFFEKVNRNNHPMAVLQFDINGASCYATSCVFIQKDKDYIRYFNVRQTVYEIFHILDIFKYYYNLYKFHGYFRLLIDISNLKGAKFSFGGEPRVNDHTELSHQFTEFTYTFESNYLFNHKKEIIDECLLPVFMGGGYFEVVNCWDSEGKPEIT